MDLARWVLQSRSERRHQHYRCLKLTPTSGKMNSLCVSLIMATDHILALSERDKLSGAIEALQGPTTTEKTVGARSKVGAAQCRIRFEAAGDDKSYSTCETEDEGCGLKGDHCGNKEAVGGNRAAKAAAGAPVAVPPKGCPSQSSRAARGEAARAHSCPTFCKNEATTVGDQESRPSQQSYRQ